MSKKQGRKGKSKRKKSKKGSGVFLVDEVAASCSHHIGDTPGIFCCFALICTEYMP